MKNIQKLKILAAVREIIVNSDFKNASLDRVSAELGISKKTIYKYFSSKSEILTILLKRFLFKNKKNYETRIRLLEPIPRLIGLFKMCDKIYSHIDDKVLRFISLYVPDGKDELKSFELSFLISSFEKIIKDGIASKHFRKDIDPLVLAILALAISKYRCRVPELKSNDQSLTQLINHFIAGVSRNDNKL
jgi:AcrR family transcriptional regulator